MQNTQQENSASDETEYATGQMTMTYGGFLFGASLYFITAKSMIEAPLRSVISMSICGFAWSAGCYFISKFASEPYCYMCTGSHIGIATSLVIISMSRNQFCSCNSWMELYPISVKNWSLITITYYPLPYVLHKKCYLVSIYNEHYVRRYRYYYYWLLWFG